MISVEKWKILYKAWARRDGLFSGLPPLPVAKSSAFAPLQETTLQVRTERGSPHSTKARLGKPELEAIFAKETWRLQKNHSGHVGEFTKFLAGKVSHFILPDKCRAYANATSMLSILRDHGATTLVNGTTARADGSPPLGPSKEYP